MVGTLFILQSQLSSGLAVNNKDGELSDKPNSSHHPATLLTVSPSLYLDFYQNYSQNVI